MNYRFPILAILVLTLAGAFRPTEVNAARPLILVFETARGDGADKDLAAATTRAIRNYFRETQRVEATVLDRESPTVLRAIMDKKLTADKVASYASQAERIEVAKALGFQYAAGAEVAIKELKVKAVGPTTVKVVTEDKAKPGDQTDSKPAKEDGTTRQITVVEVRLWLGQVDGGKNSRWEASGSSALSGGSTMDLDNAVQSAASSAVIDASRRAFTELPRVAEPKPTNGTETTAIGADQPPVSTKPTAGGYAAKAEQSIRDGNLAVAIQQYSQAVSADPTDGSLRVRLAEAYARKAMYREAEDELARASQAGADADLVADAKDRIQKMRIGETETKPEPPKPSPPENRVPMTNNKPFNGAPVTSITKMVEGDKLWNSGKPDEAAEAYKESVKLNPSDWRAHERLAVVNASMSLFGESRRALEELARIQPSPSPTVIANRYEMLRTYFDKHFAALTRQYETAGADFDKKIITRESYYNVVKGLALRMESMAVFLDAMVVPTTRKPAHLRRGLACGLMAQAASSLLDYLETNAAKSKANGDLFASQAKSEMEAAAKLDENKVVVEKERVGGASGAEAQPSTPAQPTAEQPSPEPPPAEQPPSDQPPPETPPGQ